MKLIDNIKEKVRAVVLRKELSKLKRHTSIQNFSTAKIVGFIFDARSMETCKASFNFMKFVEEQNINVRGIGIVNNVDQIGYYSPKPNIEYFSLEEVNWYNKPNSQQVLDFLSVRFDILIDISMIDLFAIKYIFANSASTFKIANTGAKAQYADFVIEINNNETIEMFAEHVTHYLASIRINL